MPKKTKEKKNLSAVILSIVSGILLIISGTHGSMRVYGIILSMLASFIVDTLALSILGVISLILTFLASLGGFSVILGGYFIDKSQVRVGKFIIGVGAGMGIPSLLLTLFTLIAKQDFSMVIAQHGIIGWTGIALSIIARTIAK